MAMKAWNILLQIQAKRASWEM